MVSKEAKMEQELQLLRESALFDGDWYAHRHVISAGVPPERHFCEQGWKNGWDPGPDFSTRRYLEGNPDVADAGINPLIHYIRCGRKEGRKITPSEENSGQLNGLPD